MIKALKKKKSRLLYKRRRYTVGPMQGLVKEIFTWAIKPEPPGR